MNILILSKGPNLYSTQSLVRAGRHRGHIMHVVDYTRCNLVIGKGGTKVFYGDQRLRFIDAIIPRIGASGTAQGVSVISQFEALNTPSTIRAETLLEVRDKLRCLQKLTRCGIDTPKTVTTSVGPYNTQLLQELGGLPVVIKLLQSTHGAGVFLVDSAQSFNSTIQAFHHLKERFLVQEYIREASGTDVRVLVVAGQIVAAMIRTAQNGEFRSNLHLGASAQTTPLTPEEEAVVKKVVKVTGLEVAGIDLLRSSRGPLVIEVNASPGLEGIETTTGIDVAGRIIELLETKKRALQTINRK